MRILSIHVENFPPIGRLEVESLSDFVILAGPNGVGKSRLLSLLAGHIATLSSGRGPFVNPQVGLKVSPTNDAERSHWGERELDTSNEEDAAKFARYLQSSPKRREVVGRAIYFGASRRFAIVQAGQTGPQRWDQPDPLEVRVDPTELLSDSEERFRGIVRTLYELHTHRIAEYGRMAHELEKTASPNEPLKVNRVENSFRPFQDVFSLLLRPKQLNEIDPYRPALTYLDSDGGHQLDHLSSGEREVISIAFDLVLHHPSDCVILIDEPELHLHPELCDRLLSAIRHVGLRNQFICCTHSAALVGTSLDHTLVFLSSAEVGKNQAICADQDGEQAEALSKLSQSLGIISAGRQIVLIEGEESSVDVLVYRELSRQRYPGLVFTPCGSRDNILGSANVLGRILDTRIWGVDFFMIADRDYSLTNAQLAELETKYAPRLRFLPRYSIENYFLDGKLISLGLVGLHLSKPRLKDPAWIDERLRAIAATSIPSAMNIALGSRVWLEGSHIDLSVELSAGMSREAFQEAAKVKALTETERTRTRFAPTQVTELIDQQWARLEGSLLDPDSWRSEYPGKIILGKFAHEIGLKPRDMISACVTGPNLDEFEGFADVLGILKTFWNHR